MKSSKNSILSVFLLFISFYCFGNNIIIVKDSIKWLGLKEFRLQENNPSRFPYFENATYSFENGILPSYKKQVQLSGAYNHIKNITITNAIYEDVPQQELFTIQNNKSIIDYPVVTGKIGSSVGVYYCNINLLPYKKNNTSGTYERLVYFEISIELSTLSASSKQFHTQSTHTFANTSVLASGNWYKIGVTQPGIFKIDYSFLENMGIDINNTDPRNIRIYGNGGGMLPLQNSISRYDDLQENAIEVNGEADGVFNTTDYILFYAEGPDEWTYSTSDQKFHHKTNVYSDTVFYFLTADLGTGKRIQTQASSAQSATHTVTSFDDYAFHEQDASNLIKSGREWYGEKMDILNTLNFSFNFPNLITTSTAYIKAALAARYDAPTLSNTFTINTNGGSINLSPASTNFNCYWCDFAMTASNSFTFTPVANPIPVTVTKNVSSITGWLNYIEVNARRQLSAAGAGNQFPFRDINCVGSGNVSEFILSNTNALWKIWDVTDILNVKLQATSLQGTDTKFTLPTDTLKHFVAFNGSSFYTPLFAGMVVNQNLHALKQTDMIIVSHPAFLSEAATLANLHINEDDLSVIIVTPQQIYNEFSSGAQDITAIRDFVKMFYDRANSNPDSIPKYLLLFGDASYDYKKRFTSNTNYVPAFQSNNSTSYTSSYVSDDFYGLLEDTEGDLDAGGLVDIGIGRFPVKSKSEAQTAVNKVLKYVSTGISLGAQNGSCDNSNASNFGDWRNYLCFIGDDEDGNLHTSQANQLAEGVKTDYPVFNIDKIYLDAYTQVSTPGGNRYPEVSEAIDKRIEKGALIINYTGHGGEVGLAHERIVEIAQINSWSNINKLPLMFTATCEFSRFDDPERTSAGELVFLNANGGAIALMTTVRLVYAAPNFYLNQHFYENVFDTLPNGEMPRLGDVFKLTKVASGTDLNNRNFSLLGDPALRLSYPRHSIATTTVTADTLKALNTVTVTGYVQDKYGNKLTSYNGILYPTVFDKAITITTLSNDGAQSPPMNFTLQKNVLYKGKVSVTNGDFSFSFILPKDVAGSSYGIGKISYYAENGLEDANGYYDNIYVGGSSGTSSTDVAGPEVELYMNDDKFVFGGVTNENPQLYARLKDDNGINTSGIGIGHDITAIIDANTSQQIILNDYYESDLDNYKSGSIRYPLKDLSEGKHTLKLKAWDVHNNSAEAYTEFVVAPDAELALKHVLNYPNPFTTKTSFYFEHNKPCDNLNVQVQVFTVSGKLVKSINQTVMCDGFRSDPIVWDGKDDFGQKIGRGVYLYRLKIRSTDNSTAEHIEKLVILN